MCMWGVCKHTYDVRTACWGWFSTPPGMGEGAVKLVATQGSKYLICGIISLASIFLTLKSTPKGLHLGSNIFHKKKSEVSEK